MDVNQIENFIRKQLSELANIPLDEVTGGTELIGESRAIKSRTLVELMLVLEEFAEDELGVEFDWTSDSAMSENRSIFRTVHTLSQHIHSLTVAS